MPGKIFILCGRLCSGKTTLSKELSQKHAAAILSIDELTLALFGQDAGEKLDGYVERLKTYFYQKSLELSRLGINVVLDWGFWTRAERNFARDFYQAAAAEAEFHYIDISDEEWLRRVKQRNQEILDGADGSYFVDEGLLKKFEAIFEPPQADEPGVWHRD